MQATDIPAKTALGMAEISDKGSGLPSLMRSLLRVIDGRLPVARYVTLLPKYGDVAQMIDTLEQLGLIACKPQATSRATAAPLAAPRPQPPVASAAPPRPQAPAARSSGADIAVVRAGLLDLINTQLGMDALDLMLQVESARDATALLASRASALALLQRAGLDDAAAQRLYARL